jgi:hypothetical protein
MKTLREFIDKLAAMWPLMTNEEKDVMCNAIVKGNIITVNTAIKHINKKIKTREREGLNENKTN